MLKKLYEEAARKRAAEHAEKEVDKVGTLRGGTTGHLSEDGFVSGTCHRKALVRYLGLQKGGETSSWFDMGHSNEDWWAKQLKLVYPHAIRIEGNEDAIKTRWSIGDVEITGSPDMVLCDENGNPVVGVELKSLGSISSASEVFFEGKPKLANFLQTAHYVEQVGVPFELVYTAMISGPLYYPDQKAYGAKKVNPFIMEFRVEVGPDGQIQYTKEDGTVVRTQFSTQGIARFYQLVIEMAQQKTLYNRFEDMSVSGGKPKWSPCTYCSFKELCDRYEDDYETWMDRVKQQKEIG